MTPEEQEALLERADRANEAVAATLAAYHEATAERAQVCRELRDAGVSMYALAKRLGLSTARIGQIVNVTKGPPAP